MLMSVTARPKREERKKKEKKSDVNIAHPCSSNNVLSNADNECLILS